MNITGSVSQSNNTLTIDGSGLRQTPEAQKTLSLKTGDTIQGSVVSITDTAEGKVANINVGGNEISAKLQDGMGLREGQVLNFQVRSGSQSTVTITPLFENTSPDQSTLKALMAAGIEVNNDNIQMIKEMMGAGLPINKDAVLDMSRSLTSYPHNSISTMVEMKSLGIPITQNNLTQFESYKNYEHQVTSAMENIMDELPEAFNQLMAEGNTSKALNLYGSILKLFGGEGQSADTASIEGTLNEIGTLDPSSQETADTSGNKEAGVLQEQSKTEAGAAKETLELVVQDDEMALSSGENADKGKTIVLSKDGTVSVLPEEGKEQGQGADGISGNDFAAGTRLSDDSYKALYKAQEPDSQNAQAKPLDKSFVNALKNVGVSDEVINKFNLDPKSETAQKELLKALADSFNESELSDPAGSASWKKIFSSNDYNKLLRDNISAQWHLKPTDVEKKENIENLYQRLGNQIKGMTSAISQNLGAESKLSQTATGLQNNLDFMNQLNQMFQYVQLPLQMSGQNVHGDLYVYRNRHRKMSEDGSVSAVLHLDMDNLGPVDVYVKMIESKVTTNFYVEDESILDLINDNIHILNERLEKRGYTMNVNLKLHDDIDGQDAAVDEMLSVSKTSVISTNSFDARA